MKTYQVRGRNKGLTGNDGFVIVLGPLHFSNDIEEVGSTSEGENDVG